MNKVLKTTSVLLLAGAILTTPLWSKSINTVEAEESSSEIEIGSKISIPSLNLKDNAYVLDTKFEDVTGDEIKDQVILVGSKENEKDIFITDLQIIVQDGKTKEYVKTSIGPFDGGYEGKLFVGDFNKDKVSDVLVSSANGGSGGTSSYGIFSFKDHKITTVFGQEKLSVGPQFEGHFVDGFKAEITSKDLNKTIMIDISAGKEVYKEVGIYDENGKLLKETTCATDGYGLLNPVDYDHDGTYELEGYQKMWGPFHADTVSHVKSLWKYDDAQWSLKGLELSTLLIK